MIRYRTAVPADGPPLAAMAKRCFTDTFGTLYRPQDLSAFLDQAFGAQGLPGQLDDPAYEVRVALDGDTIAGFAKLGPVVFPGSWHDAIELHQLYVLAPWQGEGVAAQLMGWAMDRGRAQGYARMVLSVFIDNHRAQRFYARYGFAEVGRLDFKVGEHVDDDRIWAAAL